MKPDRWERRMRALLKKLQVPESINGMHGNAIAYPRNIIIAEIISLLGQQRNNILHASMKELK